MSYFFSSQRLDAIKPTFEFSGDDEDDESGGVFIVEAAADPSDAVVPLLLDQLHVEQEPSLTTGFLQSTSNDQAFQATDASVHLDDIDLTQSDLRSLDDLFSAMNQTNNPDLKVSAPKSAPLCEPTHKEVQDPTTSAQHLQSSRRQVLADIALEVSPFETIGSFQMKQSLEMITDQNDKSVVKRNALTTKRRIWNLFFTCTMLMKWVFWTVPSLLVCGVVRSVLWIASAFTGVWYFGRLSCHVISSVCNPVALLILRIWSIGVKVYGLANDSLQARAAGTSSVVVAFLAGMVTMVLFGATVWLLKYSAFAAIQMVHMKIASEITRLVRKIIRKVRSVLHLRDDIVPIAMPKRPSIPTHRLDKLLEQGLDVVEKPAPVSLMSDVKKLRSEDTLSYRFVSQITNVNHKDSKSVNDPEFMFTSRIFPVTNNQTTGLRDMFANHGLGLNVNCTYLIPPMNIVFLVALAFAYIVLPRRFVTAAGAIPSMSAETFADLNGKSLDVECRKRGLKVPVLRQDKIRSLCFHDGMQYEFAQRNLLNYTNMTKVQLQLALSNLGEPSSGNKEDLQYRLLVARERVYTELNPDELKELSRKHDIKANGMELARRLAEAGPQLPLAVEVVSGARFGFDKRLKKN